MLRQHLLNYKGPWALGSRGGGGRPQGTSAIVAKHPSHSPLRTPNPARPGPTLSRVCLSSGSWWLYF